MGLAVTGIVAIKNVQKSFEQTQYGNKTVFMGTLLSKEEFGATNMEIPFKMSVSEKQAKFYDQYFMKPGQSGFAKGHIIVTPGGVALELEKMEFGALKTDVGNGSQPATNYQQATPTKTFQQPAQQATPVVGDNVSAYNNMFNNGGQEPAQEKSGGVEVPAAGNTAMFWKNMGK